MSQWARRRTLLKNLRTQPGRVAAANSAIHARPREEMSAEALGQLRNLMRDLLDGKEPRDFQLDLVQAQVEGRDTVCQAATGMGKTAVAAGPYVLPQNSDRTTLMISPLIGLQNEMVNTFRDEFKIDAIAINSAHETSSETLQDIVDGKYRIVLLSPEMLLSRRFINRVLRNRKFAANTLSIVVDEAHCISHWGANFRKKYGQIGTARAWLPRSTPVIALSASLTRRVKRDVIEVLQMQGRSHPKFFLNAGNDRGNVSIVVRPIHNPMNTYSDLDFVIPPSVTSPEGIPKTWIYVDDINAGGEIIDHLCTLLPENLRGIVRPYNAILSSECRDEAMRLFKQGDIRVLVCTDAAGMGCNIPDIEVVVQWKLPEKLSSFVQRAGRAARNPNIRGLAVLLVEPTAYSVDLLAGVDVTVAAADKTEKGGKGGKGAKRRRRRKPRRKVVKGKEYANQRGRQRGARSGKKDDFPPCDFEQAVPSHDDDAEGLYHVVQSRTCRREVIVGMFDSVKTVFPGVECCDVCAPSLLDRTRPGKNSRAAAAPRLTMAKTRDASLYAVMDDWREEVFDRDFSWSGMTPEMILPATLMDKIARIQHPLKRTVLERLLRLDWLYYDQYGQEMLDRFPRSTFPLAFDAQPSPPPTVSGDVPRHSSLNSVARKVPPAPVPRSNGKRSATDAGLVDEQRRPSSQPGKRVRSGIHMHTVTGRASPSLSALVGRHVDARERAPTATPISTTLPPQPPTSQLPPTAMNPPQHPEVNDFPPIAPSPSFVQQRRHHKPPPMNPQQYSSSYALGASQQPSYPCPSRHDQSLHPPSGSPALPTASRQRYRPAPPSGTQSIEASHSFTAAHGRPYSAASYTTFTHRSTPGLARERWLPAYPSHPLHTPRAEDYGSSPATSTAPTSVPHRRSSPVSSTLAVQTAQSPHGFYQEFTPQLNIALDPGQMRLAAPCANLDRNVICSVGRVLTPGTVHISANGRLTIARLAQVVCRCAITREAYLLTRR